MSDPLVILTPTLSWGKQAAGDWGLAPGSYQIITDQKELVRLTPRQFIIPSGILVGLTLREKLAAARWTDITRLFPSGVGAPPADLAYASDSDIENILSWASDSEIGEAVRENTRENGSGR